LSVTLDVNVLVYASNEDDPAHEPARRLLARLAAGPELVYLFWPVIMGYLRIATHPAILPLPQSPKAALENVDLLLARPHIRAPGEAPRFWPVFQATAGDQIRGRDVADAHLVALMRQHGVGTIYTRDRGFRRFDGIRVRDPFACPG
jgi:toxin-antitoxin system PIN domain toxin